MKYLWKKTLIVTLQECIQNKTCFCITSSKTKQDIGYLDISFKDFKNCSSIEKDFEFPSTNKKEQLWKFIKIGLNIRESIVEKK